MKRMNAINNNRNIEILLLEMMCLYKNINKKGNSKIVDYTRLWYVLDSTPEIHLASISEMVGYESVKEKLVNKLIDHDIFYYDDSSSKK